MKNKFAVFVLALSVSASNCTYADQYLLDEMESLKASLEHDDPDRVELSLRLADIYFDVSIQEGDGEKIIPHRKKALELYQDVLLGRDGLTKASKEKSTIIKYQIARVLGKLNQIQTAKKYYTDVFNSKNASKKVKRESAFSLAEFFEEEVSFNQADKYYLAAIKLCESIESCNYAHYKRAWLYYKEVKLDQAIKELKMALWDSKGQARDKIINDLLLFFSAATTDGQPELAFIKDLAAKTGEKQLVRKLVESFYGAGNRVAGGNVLTEWNRLNPSLFYEARLMEENYGFRDWDQVRIYLSKIEKRTIKDFPKSKEELKELKAMLKRVIVQIDSEAQVDSQYSSDLMRSIDVYLGFYPKDSMRKKLQQGWLNVQLDEKLKVSKLQTWIAQDISFGLEKSHIRKMRQSRLSLAQKLKISNIILHEAAALTKLVPLEEKREFRYIFAHEHYKNKNYDISLPIFLELAEISTLESVDDFAIQSQNLALDIYNINKDFKNITAQAAKWISNTELVSNKKINKEILNMKKISLDARFEYAASLGEEEGAEALELFTDFCFKKVYSEKSCMNAKVLAIKLGDQEKLIALLENAKDEKALLTEYELMGRFLEAAKLSEKFHINRQAKMEDYLKTSLLYEISQDFGNRDRILKKLISKIKRDKKIDKKWLVPLYITLDEAGMINMSTLTLPWNMERKVQIAERLESSNSSRTTKKMILAQSSYTGPMWGKYILNTIQKLDKKQQKIGFYGRRSKSKFQRRNRALDKLAKVAKKHLDGADLFTRIYILDMLKKSYSQFSIEILSTPLPDGLTDDVLKQVHANLNQMSAPYSQTGTDYERLQKEQLANLTEIDKNKVLDQLENEDINYSTLIEDKDYKSHKTAEIDFGQLSGLGKQLELNPSDQIVLGQFETFYKKKNSLRIASYFTGRINSLKEHND